MLDKLLGILSNKLASGTLFLIFILSIFLTIVEFIIIGYLDDVNILMFFISNLLILLFISYFFELKFNKEDVDEPN